jgi:hypothetical protein
MELAAYLDERYAEMHIGTDTGQDIAVVCERGSIFAIQQHIEQMGRECPEILTWQTVVNRDGLGADDQHSYEAAISEGWPVQRSRNQLDIQYSGITLRGASGALLGTVQSTGLIGAGREPVSANQSLHTPELATWPAIAPRPEPVSTNTHWSWKI